MTDCESSQGPSLPTVVQSERLVIRPTTRADLPYLRRWWNNPAVVDPAGDLDGMQYDERDMEEWYVRHVQQQAAVRHFMICLRGGANQPIGEFYITCDDRPGALSFALLIGEIDLWNKGYGTEAAVAFARAIFASGTCQALRIEVRRSYSRALAWCQSIGFEIEHVWANGRYLTLILTQSAFESRHGPVHV